MVNPYVGPRAFEEGEGRFFYGREEETAILAGLVMARRAALFFAQSGAGKSSLLRAALIPELTQLHTRGRGSREHTYRKMRVLPIALVGGAIPTGRKKENGNIYSLSTLLSLLPAADPETLAGLSLRDGLASLMEDEEEVPSTAGTLLIFDQFEQIFTTYSRHRADREQFFREVTEALATYPGLHVLFTMREDFIGELTPYAPLLPNSLRPRFRLERLQRPEAIKAVTLPAEEEDRRYAPGVAEELVDNLRRTQRRRQGPGAPPDGAEQEEVLAPNVEPVHLQIVCRQLWSKLLPEQKVIRAADVQAFGDVDEALSNFYEAVLEDVTEKTKVSERRLRQWFDEQLITPARTRALVYRGEAQTEGLSNEAVDILNDAYLIRAHIRGDDTWYELVHDRLVEPILESHRRWQNHFHHPVAAARQRWLAAERDPGKLLAGAQLAEAQAYAKAHSHDILEEENAFLAESVRAEEERLEQERKAAARRRNLFIAGVLVILTLSALTLWALHNAQLARSRELAAGALANLPVDSELSLLLAREGQETVYTTEAENALRRALFTSRIKRRFDASVSGCAESVDFDMSGAGQDGVGDGQLLALAASPVGNFVAAAAAGCIHIWPLAEEAGGQNAPLLAIAVGEERIWDLAYSPEGRQLAAAVDDGTVRIWDTTSGELLHLLEGEETSICEQRAMVALTFSPDGRYLAAASLDCAIHVWDVISGLSAFPPLIGHRAGVIGVDFNPDGQQLATASQDRTVKIWDLATRIPVQTLTAHTDAVRSVAYSPDGRYLASGSVDKTAILWDLVGPEPELITTFYDHTDTVTTLAFSAEGACLATAGPDRTVHVWSVPDGRPLFELVGHANWVTGVAFPASVDPSERQLPALPCGRELASSTLDGTVLLWNLAPTAEVDTFVGHREPVESAVFSPDSRRIASSSDDGIVIIWDTASGRPLNEWQAHPERINRIAYSPDGALLATAGYDGSARLWDVASGEAVGDPLAHHGAQRVSSVAFSPHGRLLATAGDDGLARLWTVATGAPAHEPLDHGEMVYGVTFSPDARLLATTGADGKVKVWTLSSGQVQFSGTHDGDVYDAAFSYDGRLLATVDWAGRAAIWEVENGGRTHLLEGHVDRLYGVHFTPDDAYLITSSADGTARVWEVESGTEVRILPGPEMNSLDLHPQGERVVIGGEDGTVRLYTLDPDELLPLTTQRLTRTFTDEECRRYSLSEECENAGRR